MTIRHATINRTFLAFALALTIAGSGMAAPANDQAPAGDAIKASVSDFGQLDKIIKQATKEAKAKGQESISINLVENPNMVQPADLVTVDYTVSDPDGRVIYSTQPDMFAQIDENYADPYANAGAATGPETVLAGFAGLFPGSGQAVLGLQKGERRTVTVPPEKGVGAKDESKIETYPRQRTVPRMAVLPVEAYLKNFVGAPEKGKQVSLSPYFPSRVVKVENGMVTLENLVADGDRIQDDFGTTSMDVQDDRIVMTLDPVIGKPFTTNDKKGMISGKNDTEFFVDYNDPLAGKRLVFDVTVHDLKKFSAFEKIDIPWNEDHDTAMDLAGREGKPMVLLLYAEWCQWSQKMLQHSFIDPRIKRYHDRFVWLKIDSDKERMYKEIFEQENFPMVVLMDSHGNIVEKMGGFQDGGTLSLELDKLLAGKIDASAPVISSKQASSASPHCKSEN